VVCTELCGAYHGAMRTQVIVHSPEDYAAWVESRVLPRLAGALPNHGPIYPNRTDADYLAALTLSGPEQIAQVVAINPAVARLMLSQLAQVPMVPAGEQFTQADMNVLYRNALSVGGLPTLRLADDDWLVFILLHLLPFCLFKPLTLSLSNGFMAQADISMGLAPVAMPIPINGSGITTSPSMLITR
jgi:hypothetical protein